MWLSRVGSERINETIDPELTIDRALETYLKKGCSREWINQRLQTIQVRKELTDEWDDRGAKLYCSHKLRHKNDIISYTGSINTV
jgi:hypothetical protein